MGRRSVGNKGDVMPRGNLGYADSPSSSTQFALLADTSRVVGTNPDGSTPLAVSPAKEEFFYYPGQSAVASGMVLSGTRTGAATVTSSGSATVVWGTETIFAPVGRGKIDGKSTGGVIDGQVTIGLTATASTLSCTNVSFRMRNNPTAATADASAWVTALAYTTGIACTTAEVFNTFTINNLQTSASINAVPFGVAIGVLSQFASTNIIGRVMENSYIHGFIELAT